MYARPRFQPTGQPHLPRLAVIDTLDGPISVADRRRPPASSGVTHKQHIYLRMLGVWVALTVLVALALDSDHSFGRDNWVTLVVVLLAGWPVMYVLTRLARHTAGPPPSPFGREPVTILMKRGTPVDEPFGRLLAALAGLPYAEADTLDDDVT